MLLALVTEAPGLHLMNNTQIVLGIDIIKYATHNSRQIL